MKATLVSEWRKITSTKMWWILAIVMFGYMAFLAAVIGFSFTQTPDDAAGSVPTGAEAAASVYAIGASLGYLFPLAAGTLAITTEFRHQTVTPSFLFQPRRGTVLAAKLVANLGIGLIYGVIGTLGSLAGGAPLLAGAGDGAFLGDGEVIKTLVFSVVALAIWALVGVGLGTLVTNQVIAIVVILAFTQFVEPILRIGLAAGGDAADLPALEDAAKFLPGAAGEALAGTSFYASTGLELLSRPAGAVVLLAYAALFVVIGRVTTLRRDVT